MSPEIEAEFGEEVGGGGIAVVPHESRAARGILSATNVGLAILAVLMFISGLKLLTEGAAGLGMILRGLRVDGMLNTLGFGWLMAYLVLSGSPIAALSLTQLSSGVLSPIETFAMINGSRFGASFIVLFTGFVYYLRGIRGRGVVTMGVLSMATTATIYLPAMLVGAVALRAGWLDGVRLRSPGAVHSLLDRIYDPITEAVAARVPDLVLFGVGFLYLLLAFRLFDQALPSMDSDVLETRVRSWSGQPLLLFLLGLLITSFTLSVSLSLSILVPLAGRGYVKREHVVPYIMGANISTFVDTLFASLLMRTPIAFTIVLTEMASVGAVSMLVLLVCFRPYQQALLAFNALVTGSRARFAVFVMFLAVLPLALLFM